MNVKMGKGPTHSRTCNIELCKFGNFSFQAIVHNPCDIPDFRGFSRSTISEFRQRVLLEFRRKSNSVSLEFRANWALGTRTIDAVSRYPSVASIKLHPGHEEAKPAQSQVSTEQLELGLQKACLEG